MQKVRDWSIIDDELCRKMRQVQEIKEMFDDQAEQLLSKTDTNQGNSILNWADYNCEINYYKEFWRYYILNEMVIKKVNELNSQNQRLGELIDEVDVIHCVRSEQSLQSELHQALSQRHKKKNRRTSQQIQKTFVCPYEKCNKNYGSDVSLNLHIKLKHDGGNKTDREKYAQSIYVKKKLVIEAQDQGDQLPDLQIKFPPGYLEQFRRQLQNQEKSGIFQD